MKVKFIEDYELVTSDDKDRAKRKLIKSGTELDVNEMSFDWWMQQGVVEAVKTEEAPKKKPAPKKTKKTETPAIPAVPAPDGE